MPTIPRRWPTEVENERSEALLAAKEAIQKLQQAQTSLDTARSKINLNQGLSTVLMADTERYVADAMSRTERIKRHMALARSNPISGRWPMVVSKQREEIEEATDLAGNLLNEAQELLGQAIPRVNANPGLSEAIAADIARLIARALTSAERIVRLLIEVGIGRD